MHKRWFGVALAISVVGCASGADESAAAPADRAEMLQGALAQDAPVEEPALEADEASAGEEARETATARPYYGANEAQAEPAAVADVLAAPAAEAPAQARARRRRSQARSGGYGRGAGRGAPRTPAADRTLQIGGGGASAGLGAMPNTSRRGPVARRAAPRPPAAAMAAPLPQNAVLASTFVGGRGAQARLEDLLDRGVMVGGENVRLQAFDELGRLPYPVPAQNAVGLHAELERSRLSTDGERVHLQIALMARRGEAPPRPRMDVRLVFDRSGSMMGEKWTHAIRAAHALVDRLQPGDTFGLISYSDEATVDLAPTRVGNGRAAHRVIDGLVTGGGTNVEAALQLASRHAPRRRQMNDVLLTVLVSDGVANVGQTNPQELGRIARQTFDRTGTLTTSVGLGTDFDEATMLAIAREGTGSYHFVRRAGDITDILQDELEERAQAVAQALRLRIELADGVVARRVYGSRVLDEQQAQAVRRTEIATDRRLARELGITRDRQRDEDRGLRIHLPSFRRADQHVVLMELEVPPGTDASQIARVSLDYKDLLARRNRDASVEVRAERTRDREAGVASTQRTVKRTVLAFQAGDALRGASDALSRGDLNGARSMLAERQRVLVAAADLWQDSALRDDANLLGRYDRVLGSAWNGWDSGSRRTLVMAMNFYGDQRMR